MMNYDELMTLLGTDVRDNRVFVVEYAMAPTWRKRIITDRAPVLRFFFTREDIIYSVKEF